MSSVNFFLIWCTFIRSLSADWVISPNRLPRADSGFAVGAYDAMIYLLGGNLYDRQFVAYDTAADTVFYADVSFLSTAIRGQNQFWTQNNHILYMIQDDSSLLAFDLETQLLTSLEYDAESTSGACLASSFDQLFVVGGTSNKYTVQILDLLTYKWIDHINIPFMNELRAHHSCTVNNNYLWAIGGSSAYISSIERIFITDISQNKWEYIDSLSVPLSDSRAISYNDYIYIIGGSTMHIINAITGTVTVSADTLPVPITASGVIEYDDIIYVFGSRNSQNSDSILQYFIPTNDPTMTPNLETIYPTTEPTVASTKRTNAPTNPPLTMNPTATPFPAPTSYPSQSPTDIPSMIPSIDRSSQPTGIPSLIPSVVPTSNPIIIETAVSETVTDTNTKTNYNNNRDSDTIDERLGLFGGLSDNMKRTLVIILSACLILFSIILVLCCYQIQRYKVIKEEILKFEQIQGNVVGIDDEEEKLQQILALSLIEENQRKKEEEIVKKVMNESAIEAKNKEKVDDIYIVDEDSDAYWDDIANTTDGGRSRVTCDQMLIGNNVVPAPLRESDANDNNSDDDVLFGGNVTMGGIPNVKNALPQSTDHSGE